MKNWKSFRMKFFASEMIGVFIGVPIALFYCIFLISFDPVQMPAIIRVAMLCLGLVVALLAMPTNYYLTYRVKKQMAAFDEKNIGQKDAEILFSRLSVLPRLHAILILARIALGSVPILLFLIFGLNMEIFKSLIIYLLALYGAYIAALIANTIVSNIVRPYIESIVISGVLSKEWIEKKQIFGVGFFSKLLFYLVIPILFTSLSVILATLISLNEKEAAEMLLMKILCVSGINILSIGFSFIFLYRSTKKSITKLRDSLFTLSRSSGDLTQVLTTDLSDEFAYISYLINASNSNLRGIIASVKTHSGSTIQSVEEVKKFFGDMGMALKVTHEITSKVRTRTEEQRNLVGKGIETIITISEDMKRLSSESETYVSQMSNLISRVDDSYSNFQNIEAQSNRFAALIDDVSGFAEEVKNHTGTLNEGISNVLTMANEVSGVSAIIREIADQINILAMNASIEASHAGESGKGFAVVGREVKKLAEATKKNLLDTADLTKKMKLTSAEGYELTQRTSEKLTGINEQVSSLRDFFTSIAGTLKDQFSTYENVKKLANDMQQDVLEINRTIQTGVQKALESADFIKNLGSLSEEISTVMKDEYNTITELDSIMQRIDTNLSQTVDTTMKLAENVDQFKA